MPEGHSIHRIARQFNDVFTGERVRVTSPQGRYAEGAALVDGARIAQAFAHGKHLFVGFDNELTLNVHLGIYGNWSFGGTNRSQAPQVLGRPARLVRRIQWWGAPRVFWPSSAKSNHSLPYRLGAWLG